MKAALRLAVKAMENGKAKAKATAQSTQATRTTPTTRAIVAMRPGNLHEQEQEQAYLRLLGNLLARLPPCLLCLVAHCPGPYWRRLRVRLAVYLPVTVRVLTAVPVTCIPPPAMPFDSEGGRGQGMPF